MQVVITATSSIIDEDTVLIEVATKIGDSVQKTKAFASLFELTHSRYLAGTIEERIETLRKAAQDTAEESFKAQYDAALAFQQVRAELAQPDDVEVPVKKTRKPRTAKPTDSQE